MRTVIIGSGALGAPLAEHLVRGGVTEMTLIDKDYLAAGNLVRHSLTMDGLGWNKPEKLETRMNSANPHACVRATAKNFSPEVKDPDEILQADLVIDATGSDEVAAYLNSLVWKQPKHLISKSIGRKARRFYAFYEHGIRLPIDNFNDSLTSYLREGRRRYLTSLRDSLSTSSTWSCSEVQILPFSTFDIQLFLIQKQVVTRQS